MVNQHFSSYTTLNNLLESCARRRELAQNTVKVFTWWRPEAHVVGSFQRKFIVGKWREENIIGVFIKFLVFALGKALCLNGMELTIR